MSSKSTFLNSTSKSYALALYELAKESSELNKVEDGINGLKTLLSESFDFKEMILNPTVTKEEKNKVIIKFATTIKSQLPKLNNVNILGPVLAPITKLRKKYRCRILIRCPKNLFIQKYLSLSLDKIKMTSGIKLEVDVDPVNFS